MQYNFALRHVSTLCQASRQVVLTRPIQAAQVHREDYRNVFRRRFDKNMASYYYVELF